MSLDNNHTPPDDDRNGLEKAVEGIANIFNKVTDIDFKPKAPDEGAPALVIPFFKAVKNNRLEEVKALLAQGVSPNSYDKSGFTALHIAARENLEEMITLLVEAGATPHLGKKGDPTRTPLEDAVNYGSNAAVAVLARLGGFVPGQRIDGWSLLHRATEKGKAPAVAALLAAGADANERTDNGATPLLIAIQRRQPEVATLLLDHESVVDGLNVLYVETDDSKRTAFHLAIVRGETAVVEKMIAKGAFINTPDADGALPLEKAIVNGHLDIIRLLVRAGADLDKAPAGRETPLLIALSSSEIRDEKIQAQIVALLVEGGADIDAISPLTGMTALHAAALSGNGRESLRVLLQYPAALEIRDKAGLTPLFYAVNQNSDEKLSLLLQAGADMNARSGKDAATPLIFAIRAGRFSNAVSLLQQGANTSLCDASNRSALSYAREHSKQKGLVDLLEKALLVRRDKERQRLEKKKAPKNGQWKF